jgi:hypothetical protein
MGDVVGFPANEIEDNSLDRNFKFFPHETLLFALRHEHAAGIRVDPHVRCQIAGPWGEKGAIKEVWLDVDIDLFSILPDTSIFDDETGHMPQA